MLNQTANDALNAQLRHELASSYLYLAMAAHFQENALPGFAHWMRLQSQEEYAHAMKFLDFIHQRGGHVELGAIPEPAAEFTSSLGVFEKALAHERGVTDRIHRLFELAQTERDYPTQSFLQWFIDEQVEEESVAQEIVDQLRLAGDDSAALLLLDRQLAARQLAAPAPSAG